MPFPGGLHGPQTHVLLIVGAHFWVVGDRPSWNKFIWVSSCWLTLFWMSAHANLYQPMSAHVRSYVLILSDQIVMVSFWHSFGAFFKDIHISFRLDKFARGLTQPLCEYAYGLCQPPIFLDAFLELCNIAVSLSQFKVEWLPFGKFPNTWCIPWEVSCQPLLGYIYNGQPLSDLWRFFEHLMLCKPEKKEKEKSKTKKEFKQADWHC